MKEIILSSILLPIHQIIIVINTTNKKKTHCLPGVHNFLIAQFNDVFGIQTLVSYSLLEKLSSADIPITIPLTFSFLFPFWSPTEIELDLHNVSFFISNSNFPN